MRLFGQIIFSAFSVFSSHLTWCQTLTVPSNPSIENCRELGRSRHERIMEIHRESSRCMAQSGSFQGIGSPPNPSCSNFAPYQVTMIVTGYPQCFQREEELCLLHRAESEVTSCFSAARAKAKSDEFLQEQFEKFNRIEKKINNLRGLVKNPSKTYWDIVETRLPSRYKAQLGLDVEVINRNLVGNQIRRAYTPGGDSLVVVKLFEQNGDFSKRGLSLVQESYDFVYGKSIGKKDVLLERNPIIQAIQGTAAQEIRRIHSDSIRNLELIAADVATVTENEYPSLRANRIIVPRRSGPVPVSPSDARKNINGGDSIRQDDAGKVF